MMMCWGQEPKMSMKPHEDNDKYNAQSTSVLRDIKGVVAAANTF